MMTEEEVINILAECPDEYGKSKSKDKFINGLGVIMGAMASKASLDHKMGAEPDIIYVASLTDLPLLKKVDVLKLHKFGFHWDEEMCCFAYFT